MHEIEQKAYGFKVAFQGFFQGPDVEHFAEEMKRQVAHQSGSFAVLVDLREARTFPPEAQTGLMEIIGFCAEKGMDRNVIVVNSAISKIQANRLARESGVIDVRFLDAAEVSDWEKVAEDWLIRGKEFEAMA